MTEDIGHLFIYLFAMYVSPLIRLSIQISCLFVFNSAACFFFDLCYLYILHIDICLTSSLTDACFANFFFQQVACLFILLIFLKSKIFNSTEVQIIYFFLRL